jgi:hypothetical protein
MLMSVEKWILYIIDTDDIINNVAGISRILTKELMYWIVMYIYLYN